MPMMQATPNLEPENFEARASLRATLAPAAVIISAVALAYLLLYHLPREVVRMASDRDRQLGDVVFGLHTLSVVAATVAACSAIFQRYSEMVVEETEEHKAIQSLIDMPHDGKPMPNGLGLSIAFEVRSPEPDEAYPNVAHLLTNGNTLASAN